MKVKKDKRTMHQKEVDRIYEAMSEIDDLTSEEYQNLEDSLQKLANVQKTQYEATDGGKNRTEIIKTLLTLGISLSQILLILNAEEIALKVVHSKALGFLVRGRV